MISVFFFFFSLRCCRVALLWHRHLQIASTNTPHGTCERDTVHEILCLANTFLWFIQPWKDYDPFNLGAGFSGYWVASVCLHWLLPNEYRKGDCRGPSKQNDSKLINLCRKNSIQVFKINIDFWWILALYFGVTQMTFWISMKDLVLVQYCIVLYCIVLDWTGTL